MENDESVSGPLSVVGAAGPAGSAGGSRQQATSGREGVTEVTEAIQRRERHGMGGYEGRVAAWVVVRAGAREEVRVAAVAMVRAVEDTGGV